MQLTLFHDIEAYNFLQGSVVRQRFRCICGHRGKLDATATLGEVWNELWQHERDMAKFG